MTTKNIKKILLNKYGNNFVADIEDIENRITQNNSNLETAKQELSNKCNEALSEAKAYTDTEKAKYLPLTGGTVTGLLNCTASNATADVNNKKLTSYIADIMGANAQLSIIKGDGTTSVLSINNVLNATKATNADNATNLGGYPATDYIRSVNGINADENGNIQLGSIVKSVNSIAPDEHGNVQLGNLGALMGAVTGKIEWFAFNTAPDGYLVCNGATVSRETYADLFAVIGTTFGNGDGSTTFALPNLIDKFAQGSTTVGTIKSAGLPNITGSISGIYTSNSVKASGAFANASNEGAYNGNNVSEFNSSYDFYASRSSSIYGNSDTVQPPALTLLPCIKY